MDPQLNLLQLETLFPNEIKDIRNHLNHVYENSNNSEFVPSVPSINQNTSLNTNLPMTIKTEPKNIQEDVIVRAHTANNMNVGIHPSYMSNDRAAQSFNPTTFSTPYSSPININPSNQVNYSNYDNNWSRIIQSKISVPLNSTEGHTEMMLMILKAQNDNQNLLTNIFKKLDGIERNYHIDPSSVNSNLVIPPPPQSASVSVPAPATSSVPNVQNIQKVENQNFSQPIFTIPESTVPMTDFFSSPIENDYHLHQFETNLNDPNFRMSVIQRLRQRTGTNIRETVRRMIFCLITKEFSQKFNRTGANNKYAFKLKLEPLIKEAVVGLYTCPERDVEVAIVRALKEAKFRVHSKKK